MQEDTRATHWGWWLAGATALSTLYVIACREILDGNATKIESRILVATYVATGVIAIAGLYQAHKRSTAMERSAEVAAEALKVQVDIDCKKHFESRREKQRQTLSDAYRDLHNLSYDLLEICVELSPNNEPPTEQTVAQAWGPLQSAVLTIRLNEYELKDVTIDKCEAVGFVGAVQDLSATLDYLRKNAVKPRSSTYAAGHATALKLQRDVPDLIEGIINTRAEAWSTEDTESVS